MSDRTSVPVASGRRRKSADTMTAPVRRARSRIQFVKKRARSEAPVTLFWVCVSDWTRDVGPAL